jgi:hypothetical protein
VLALVLGLVLLALGRVVSAMVEHRGATHSLGVCAVLTLVGCVGSAVAGQPWTLGLWFGWGYLSHLLADLITPLGCPALFWPLGSGDLSAMQAVSFPSMTHSVTRSGGPSAQRTAHNAVRRGGPSAPNDKHSGSVVATIPRPPMGNTQPGLQPAGGARQPARVSQVEMGGGVAVSDLAAGGSSTMPHSRGCPRCGGALIMRKARRGVHTGNKFYGCANYPRCRYIENLAG